jgi:hypothetical protein
VDRIDYGNTLAVPVEYSAYSQITANLLAYFITSVYTTGSLVTVGTDAPSLRRCTVALITRYISAHDVAVVGVDYGCGSRKLYIRAVRAPSLDIFIHSTHPLPFYSFTIVVGLLELLFGQPIA